MQLLNYFDFDPGCTLYLDAFIDYALRHCSCQASVIAIHLSSEGHFFVGEQKEQEIRDLYHRVC